MQQKILVFHPALAAYRVDFFNAINENYDARFYFEHKEQRNHTFSKNHLESKCTFKFNYLSKGFEFLGRSVRFGIWPIIKNERPNIILCGEYGPVTLSVFLFYLLSRKGFRLYTISDDSIESCLNRKGLRSFARNIVSKNIDGVIFPSQEVCNWYRSNISKKPKTLELPIIHNEDVFRSELFKSLNTANSNIKLYNLKNKKVILFVGRLVEIKNVSLLIKVCSRLKQSDWALVIVGNGTLMNDLINQVIELNITDKVHFTDKKEGVELLSWFTIAQLFVLPSTFERFGAVVNESLLGGCTVLCSELAGASTLITKENGRVFNPYKENELLELIENSLEIVDPITSDLQSLRESKMPFTFDEKINELFENL